MSTTDDVVIIGLTGGIASGKSTVAKIMEEAGVATVDADAIARDIVEPGRPALSEIAQSFGRDVLEDDGTLDRAALANRVFHDPEARARLNAITHPRIGMEMMNRARAAQQQGHRWVVYNAALLVENQLHRALDSLIVVAAKPQTQLRRLMERDGLSMDDATARMDAQMPLADKIAAADYVINNDATPSETRRQVERLVEHIEGLVREFRTANPNRIPTSKHLHTS